MNGFDAVWMRGAELFDAGRYDEAHEAWEAGWRACARGSSASNLLQGLVQCAAACLKLQRNELRGARSLAIKGTRLLEAASMSADWPVTAIDPKLFVQRMRAVFEKDQPMSIELPKLLPHDDPDVIDHRG